MKKVINGKMYNTDTANYLAKYTNGGTYGSFHYLREKLYQKTNGEFFLVGESGAYEKYAEKNSDSSSAGIKIIPLTQDQAKKWAEFLDGDDYVEIFGEVEE